MGKSSTRTEAIPSFYLKFEASEPFVISKQIFQSSVLYGENGKVCRVKNGQNHLPQFQHLL